MKVSLASATVCPKLNLVAYSKFHHQKPDSRITTHTINYIIILHDWVVVILPRLAAAALQRNQAPRALPPPAAVPALSQLQPLRTLPAAQPCNNGSLPLLLLPCLHFVEKHPAEHNESGVQVASHPKICVGWGLEIEGGCAETVSSRDACPKWEDTL